MYYNAHSKKGAKRLDQKDFLPQFGKRVLELPDQKTVVKKTKGIFESFKAFSKDKVN